MFHLDPRTPKCENKVHRIIHLQEVANWLPNIFNDTTKVTYLHIPALNTPTRIIVSEEQHEMDQTSLRPKCERPIRSKDVAPHKRMGEIMNLLFKFKASCFRKGQPHKRF